MQLAVEAGTERSLEIAAALAGRAEPRRGRVGPLLRPRISQVRLILRAAATQLVADRNEGELGADTGRELECQRLEPVLGLSS